VNEFSATVLSGTFRWPIGATTVMSRGLRAEAAMARTLPSFMLSHGAATISEFRYVGLRAKSEEGFGTMVASLDGVCYFWDPLGYDGVDAERGVAAVESKTKTSADETRKELATTDSIGAVCRCVLDVPGDGRNVGNDPASEAGESRPLWPLCCGSVKAALVAVPAADHRAQLAQHCAVLCVTRAAYVVSDGGRIIRVECVSFAKHFLATYTRVVTSSVLAAMPWVTCSPDQIPDLPLETVGILEDSDHLREHDALVRAVLEHSQSHRGDTVVPLHVIRPELIAYWNRVGKTGTDQMSQYLASVRGNDGQWPAASRILFRHVEMPAQCLPRN
jgi:hypothetical protein